MDFSKFWCIDIYLFSNSFQTFFPQEIEMKMLFFLHFRTPKKHLAYQAALYKMTLHEIWTWSLVVNLKPHEKIKPCPACWQSSSRTSGSIPDLVFIDTDTFIFLPICRYWIFFFQYRYWVFFSNTDTWLEKIFFL